eukprot:1184978-Prorocentrum_minimum.AAC.1
MQTAAAGDKMGEAVEECIEAAGHEFDISLQRSLLRAASYGRTFLQTLRVLNAARAVEVRAILYEKCGSDMTSINRLRVNFNITRRVLNLPTNCLPAFVCSRRRPRVCEARPFFFFRPTPARRTARLLPPAFRAAHTRPGHDLVGIPLSYAEYEEFTPRAVVARLLSTHKHLLALRVSALLDLPADRVLLHWATAKMQASSKRLLTNDPPLVGWYRQLGDKEVLDLLLDKLSQCAGISWAQIAATAHRRGRPRLAAMLLDHEPCAAEQVRPPTLGENGIFE